MNKLMKKIDSFFEIFTEDTGVIPLGLMMDAVVIVLLFWIFSVMKPGSEMNWGNASIIIGVLVGISLLITEIVILFGNQIDLKEKHTFLDSVLIKTQLFLISSILVSTLIFISLIFCGIAYILKEFILLLINHPKGLVIVAIIVILYIVNHLIIKHREVK